MLKKSGWRIGKEELSENICFYCFQRPYLKNSHKTLDFYDDF